MTTVRTVTVSVDPESDEQLTRAVEVLGRAVAGLTLDGMDVRLSTFHVEVETEITYEPDDGE